MYDWIKDVGGPIATMIQNVILGVGAYIAWTTIKSNQQIAARRATLDVIQGLANDREYNDHLRTVNRMRIEKRDPGSVYSDMKNQSLSPQDRDAATIQFKAAQYVLKRLAIIANGLKNGSLDDQSFKEHYYSTFVENVEYLRAFILSIRGAANNQIHHSSKFVSPDTIYSEVLELLDQWKKSPLGQPKVS